MKKYLSVFGLFARSSIYKVLGVLLLMGIAEFGLFYYALDRAVLVFEAGIGDGMAHFEELVTSSRVPWCFAVAFIFITILICLPGTEFQSKTGYTLRRLSVSERSVLLVQSVYNMAVYVVLLAVQVLICFGLGFVYTSQIPAELVGNQTIFLAFYRSEFLHALLPLSEAGLWLRNAFLVIGLGFAAAEFPYNQRRKGYGVAVIVLGIYTILSFEIGIGSIGNIFFSMIVVALYVGNAIYNVFRKEGLDED